MASPLEFADPFFGNGETTAPIPKGIAAAWNWRKAQTGNTHPGATRPFGMVSVCAYSGAYPTGYGLYDLTTKGPARRLFDKPTATGFTHFQLAGVGNALFFYNYLKAVPLRRWEDRGARWTLAGETARPGYYAARLAETGIRAELTSGGKSAFHRYSFAQGGRAFLALDLSSGGVEVPDHPELRIVPDVDRVSFPSPRSASGRWVADGFSIYFFLETDLPGERHGAWRGRERAEAGTAASFGGEKSPFGIYFEADSAERPVQLRIGFSFRSEEQARANMAEVAGITFEEAVSRAERDWSERLSRIEVETPDRAVKTRFYSCLYHSLVKPACCAGESPYWDDEPFFEDFATLWDMYKTQLPLVMALYREPGQSIGPFILRAMEQHGFFPVGYMMRRTLDLFEDQAAGLAWCTLADAWRRYPGALDPGRVLRQMRAFVEMPRVREFITQGFLHPATHTLDLAGAFHAMSCLAGEMGDRGLADELARHVAHWRNAYDAATGLLRKDSKYYEGTLWNYSFRPHPGMAERVRLAGGRERFVELLDTFFGYGDIAGGAVDPAPTEGAWRRRMRHNRFEGVHNEPDMETPYAYIWAGRHDRAAEVVRAAMRWQFSDGAGGLPGNNDSGGLTSWYVWSALGLYPIAGEPFYLVGSPLFESAAIHFVKGKFRIVAQGVSDECLYVREARLNGVPLDRAWLPIKQVEAGGELVLKMDRRPSAWAQEPPPL